MIHVKLCHWKVNSCYQNSQKEAFVPKNNFLRNLSSQYFPISLIRNRILIHEPLQLCYKWLTFPSLLGNLIKTLLNNKSPSWDLRARVSVLCPAVVNNSLIRIVLVMEKKTRPQSSVDNSNLVPLTRTLKTLADHPWESLNYRHWGERSAANSGSGPERITGAQFSWVSWRKCRRENCHALSRRSQAINTSHCVSACARERDVRRDGGHCNRSRSWAA